MRWLQVKDRCSTQGCRRAGWLTLLSDPGDVRSPLRRSAESHVKTENNLGPLSLHRSILNTPMCSANARQGSPWAGGDKANTPSSSLSPCGHNPDFVHRCTPSALWRRNSFPPLGGKTLDGLGPFCLSRSRRCSRCLVEEWPWALAGVAQLVAASFHKPEGHGFDSGTGHMPRLWVQPPVGVGT